MSKMSLPDKIGILFEVSKKFNLLLLVIVILLYLGFTFINSNKKNKKRITYTYVVSSVFIFVSFIMTYHTSLSNLFDYMMNNFFIAVYFPNLAIYTFALLVTNIILLVSIFDYKISKIIKSINVVVYLLMNYLLSLILNVIKTDKLDIFTQKSVYGSTKATALIELSSLLFIVWIIFLIVYRIILIYLKKEYVPPVKKIIRLKKVKKLPHNFIPKEVPIYVYGRVNFNKKQKDPNKDLLKEYEKLFTIEDYRLLSKILREQKKEEIKVRKVTNKVEPEDDTPLKIIHSEPIITAVYPSDSSFNKKQEPVFTKTIHNEMTIDKPQENTKNKQEMAISEEKVNLKLDQESKFKLESERLKREHETKIREEHEKRLLIEKEEQLKLEQVREQRKFTELEELYKSMG